MNRAGRVQRRAVRAVRETSGVSFQLAMPLSTAGWKLAPRECRTAISPTIRSGFTLLEMLIALVLTSLLMTGLWTLFATYERLFARGQTVVEEAQLARTLLEQISNDLKSAIPDHAAGMLGEGAALRRFGLFGTQQALQVDVLQTTPAQLIANSHTPETESTSARIVRVPELHTVQYLLQESDEASGVEGSGLAGLVRRELDWETPLSATEPAARDGVQPPPAAADPMEIAAGGLDPAEETLLQVPEVSGLEFRYYDGSGWASQWNSLTQKSLPVAVEVTLILKRTEPAGAKRQTLAATEDEELTELLDQEASLPAGPRHRLLVFLPSTALLRETRPATDESSPSVPQAAPLPPVVRPPPVPAPVVPRPPAFAPPTSGSAPDALRSVLPEQWLRSGT